jgi:N,N'-diacetylchitobiose transport system substrate-binding protein
MRHRVLAAATMLAVLLGLVAATASASPQRAQANKLTVWLQVDAQSGWPDVVAAANQQFQKDHPGWTVDVQYQNWGDHLQKFDATLAGGNTPDVIEMGNTEMTKYMAAGAFADLTSAKSTFANSANWLVGLAKSGLYGGKVYGVPYYAGSRVVTYRTDLWNKAGIKSAPSSLAQFTADIHRLAVKNSKVKSFSPVYTAGTDWYFAMSFVYDYGGSIARTHAGKWIGNLDSKASIAGLTAWKNFFKAASKAPATSDENNPPPYNIFGQGQAGSIVGPGLVQLLHRCEVQGRDRTVRDAESRPGQADAGLPRRL